MRRIGIAGATVALALCASACGPAMAPTTGAVPGSENRPHLSAKEFVPAVAQSMAKVRSFHVAVRAESGGDRSTLDADISLVKRGAIQMTQVDPIGVFGRPFADKQEVRLLGGRMYFSDGSGKKQMFLALDVSNPSSAPGKVAAGVRADSRPQQVLDPISKGLKKLDYKGLVARDGMYLDHYRAVIDVRRGLPRPEAALLRGESEIDYDVWIDSEKLVRQVSYEAKGLSMTTTLSNWGKRVEIDVPAPKTIIKSG